MPKGPNHDPTSVYAAIPNKIKLVAITMSKLLLKKGAANSVAQYEETAPWMIL